MGNINNSIEQISQPNTLLELLEKIKQLPVEAVIITSGSVKKTIIEKGKDVKVISDTDIIPDLDSIATLGEEESLRKVKIGLTDYRNSKFGGKGRSIAAIELINELPSVQGNSPVTVVTSSWAPNNKTDVSDASLAASYLKRNGVENEIILQEKSIDTFTELLEAFRLAIEKKWKHIAVVVGEIQLKRARAMADTLLQMNTNPLELQKVKDMLTFNANRFNQKQHLSAQKQFLDTYQYLKDNSIDIEISIITTEDVLLNRDPKRYGELIKEVRARDSYQTWLANDKTDNERWKHGTYIKQLGPEYVTKWEKGDFS